MSDIKDRIIIESISLTKLSHKNLVFIEFKVDGGNSVRIDIDNSGDIESLISCAKAAALQGALDLNKSLMKPIKQEGV